MGFCKGKGIESRMCHDNIGGVLGSVQGEVKRTVHEGNAEKAVRIIGGACIFQSDPYDYWSILAFQLVESPRAFMLPPNSIMCSVTLVIRRCRSCRGCDVHGA